MGQAHELPIEDGVLAQSADGNAHAALVIYVELDLRAVVLGEVLDEVLRRVRQAELGRLGGVVHQTINELFLGGLLAEVQEHGGGVAVEHGHADTLGRDLEVAVERHNLALVGVHMAEHLERFLLALCFLAGNERDDVAHHLRPILEGLARAGNRLIGADDHLAWLEFLPRGQRRSVGLNRAVRLDGDETACGAKALALVLDHREVFGVDLRHHHRHVRGPAVGAVVGYHRGLGLGITLFDGANLVLRHVHRGEHEVHVRGHGLGVVAVRNHHVLGVFGHRRFHLPTAADGLLIRLAGAVCGSGKRDHFEPRVVFQQRDETLADHTGGAENADLYLFGHDDLYDLRVSMG